MKLVFEDGTTFTGESFGAEKSVFGEVVFNTGMSGYVETLTDPSYCGQILTTTYPLQGNYGVPNGPFESDRIQIMGMIVGHYSENPSHYTQVQSLGSWLKSQNIPGICGVDTRTLTRYLREFGTANAKLVADENEKNIFSIKYSDCITMVAPKEISFHGNGKTCVLLIDTGGKENIIRSLVNRGVTVIRCPWNADWEQYLREVDGIFFTNGPGDPMDASGLIDRIRKVINQDLNIPIFGICLGHQLLALAAGAKTVKMKYGHRSVNQPVRDIQTGKCYVTSQNHGYVVQAESVSKNWEPWFVNINDGTNEGLMHKTKPISSVQFHPEANPGPNDTNYLFDDYVNKVKSMKKTRKPLAKTKPNGMENKVLHEKAPIS